MGGDAMIKIYVTEHCPFCVRAKELLTRKGLEFEVIDLTSNLDELNKLKDRTGMRTVPQIFIKEKFIGGFSELSELDGRGGLEQL